MKFFFDLLPVIIFFAVFKLYGIYPATAAAIAATAGQIGWTWLRHRKVDRMLWVSLGIIAVLGGATLLFHNETFIKWKPTVLYWVFATVLAGSDLLFRKNLIRSVLEEQVSLPEPVWSRLNLSWSGFFALMGIANLYVAYSFPTETWVNFKVFGGVGLVLVFVLLQALMLARYVQDEEA